MHNIKSLFFFLTILFSVLNCSNSNIKVQYYEDQIGDTPLNPELDNVSFKFCDSTKVLHKRALIQYNGGFKAMHKDLLNAYTLKDNYTSFSGSIIIRFAVNCSGELGRFRTQIVDSNFSQTEAPKGLESHIISILKDMKGWNQAYYREHYLDCYTFIVVKFEHGKISIE